MLTENNVNVINLDNIKIKEQLTRYREERLEKNVSVTIFIKCQKILQKIGRNK